MIFWLPRNTNVFNQSQLSHDLNVFDAEKRLQLFHPQPLIISGEV